MGFNSAFKGLKIVKNPGNGRLNNLNDLVLNVLTARDWNSLTFHKISLHYMHMKLVSLGQWTFPSNTGFSYAQILIRQVSQYKIYPRIKFQVSNSSSTLFIFLRPKKNTLYIFQKYATRHNFITPDLVSKVPLPVTSAVCIAILRELKMWQVSPLVARIPYISSHSVICFQNWPKHTNKKQYGDPVSLQFFKERKLAKTKTK